MRVKLAFVAVLCGASVSGCAGSPILSSAINCAAFIPNSFLKPVEDVPPPADNSIGGWIAVADARSGKVDDANGRTQAVIETMDQCQAQQERLSRRKFLGLF